MNGSTADEATKNAIDDSSIRLNVNSDAIVDQVDSGLNSKQTADVNGKQTIQKNGEQIMQENGKATIKLNGNVDGTQNGNDKEEEGGLINSNACSDGSCVLPGESS